MAASFLFESIPKIGEKFEIQAYKRSRYIRDLIKTHVPFPGPPQPHPYESDQVILIPDPFSTHTFHYEFKTENISFIGELPSLDDLYRGSKINAYARPRLIICRGGIYAHLMSRFQHFSGRE